MKRAYKSWDISKVPENERREFIIGCLADYIAEVNEMVNRNFPCGHDYEIIEISDFYKEIIHQLQMKS